jgi:hypothetical protein
MEWRDPPKVSQPNNVKPPPEWADKLVANPGQWAMVETFPFGSRANNLQYLISHNKMGWQKEYPGRWEAAKRIYENGEELFVRYMPE